MSWRWVLAILALLLLLLCRMRVGIRTGLLADAVTLDVRIGPIRIHILPAHEKKRKKKERDTGKKAEAAGKSKKGLPEVTLSDIQEAFHTLWPPLKRALERTRRGIRIEPLSISVIVGGAEDPAAGAELYGRLHCGVWTVMPALEQVLVIPDPYIHIGLDFDSPRTRAEGTVGISIRIGTLLLVGVGVGIPALRWLLRFWKNKKPPVSDGEEHIAA